MAPGLFFAMLMIVGFALFVINGVALFDPFGSRHWHLILTTLLALNFFGISHNWHSHCFTYLLMM